MSSFIIKRLNDLNRDKVKEHFFRLDEASRYSRFCSHMKDEMLEKYIAKMNFEDSGIFGVFDESLNIIGVGECVIIKDKDFAEVAFSVEQGYQGNGLGVKLMERIVRFAKSQGKHHLEMNCLRSNVKSVHIAKKFGLKIQHDYGSETVASIDMKDTLPAVENFNEKVEDTFAYYALQQRTHLNNWKKSQELLRETMATIVKIASPKFF